MGGIWRTTMEILKLCQKNPEYAALKTAEIIMGGGVCVCPTDTVYGLLANALDPKAVEKVYRMKQRDQSKPLPIFVKSIAAAKMIAMIGPEIQEKLSGAWPGKTTFVLNLRPGVEIPAANGKTIALRIPKHPFISALLHALDFPVIGTSANLAGYGPFTEIGKVRGQFKNTKEQPDLMIDAGNLPGSKPSTIIDLAQGAEIIIRD